MSSKPSTIFLVDMQSFYVSVEKARDPLLQHKPVVVAGDPERRSGIILSACPLAKKWGVKTGEALWEAEQKCPQLVVIRPRMQSYIEVSVQITSIMESFTDLVEAFSIDEQFLDLTPTLHFYPSAEEAAKRLQEKIMNATGVYSRIGIGPNKILAKMACDQFAKKNKRGIFTLTHETVPQVMWPLPIGKLFGVGRRMRTHFERMGVRTIGQLANFPLPALQKRWGINGEVLWRSANGLDSSPVSPNTHEQQKGIGHQMTLPHDYESWEEIKVVLLELCEEVGYRARKKGFVGQTLSVGARGASFDYPTGFHRQIKLTYATNFGLDLFHVASELFLTHWDEQPVRQVGVALTGLESTDSYQLNLFDLGQKKENLSLAMDQIKGRYGKAAILRAVSLLNAGQAKGRAQKIGGHYK